MSLVSPAPTIHYTLKRLIGKGAFGEVYLAIRSNAEGLHQQVAIKILHERLQGHPTASKRIRDEARILSQFQHPSVVRVLDLVQLEGRWAVVMDYIPGIDLDRLILHYHTNDLKIPLAVITQIGIQVAEALDAAYFATDLENVPLRIVHRDIKPANIRLTTNGDIKVMDFGIAQATMDARESETRTNDLMGTLGYLAPERVTLTSTGPEGDIYALCATLVELITHQPIGRSLHEMY